VSATAPASFVTVDKTAMRGQPDLNRASTSHVERKNGSLREWCKRLTRLTYAFSKKWENLQAALTLHFAYYNFCRVHFQFARHASHGSGDRRSGVGNLRSHIHAMTPLPRFSVPACIAFRPATCI
jgi:hypothetical protein